MKKYSLDEFLNSGWEISPAHVFPINKMPIRIEQIRGDRRAFENASHVVLLSKNGASDKFIYPICGDQEQEAAERLVAEMWEPVGYNMRVICQASSLDGEVKIENYIDYFKDISGDKWKIQADKDNKRLYIYYNFTGNDKKEGYIFLSRLDGILLSLTLKNKISFTIKNVGWGEICAAQPYASWCGEPERVPERPDKKELEIVKGTKGNPAAEEVLFLLREYYGQVTHASKIVFGLNAINELLDTEPTKPILSKRDREKIFTSVESVRFEDDEIAKRAALKRDLPRMLSEITNRTRNQRVSRKISELLGISEKEAVSNMRNAANVRGKFAHTTDKRSESFSDVELFIERVLFACVEKLTPKLSATGSKNNRS